MNYYTNGTPNLEDYKITAYAIIDKDTEAKIFLGFTFDSQVFSMSLSAQINWSNLFNIPQAMFPLPIMTKDEQSYVLEYADLNAFYDTALNYKNTCLQNGSNTKEQVKNATTVAEINNILNNL